MIDELLSLHNPQVQAVVRSYVDQGGHPLALGFESAVILLNGRVYKVYPPSFGLKKILLYEKLTAQARNILDKQDTELYNVQGANKYKWRVVPIDNVSTENACPVTQSGFIDGPNMDDYSSEREGLFQHPILGTINMDAYRKNHDALRRASDMVGKKLRQDINITGLNVKPTTGGLLYVTDLTGNVNSLRT
ncbi:hypothetical protein A3D77_00755 [Candidatus Gottesmanbacteria bacterium RIFCSPHIGHO2_02_FULL_39_11]|uniref:Uncharacterized protein n=1 Tax=Candidatus Gottesmanbacteria bacterium RIFCSPHIGHO2_02_FULL_39_11 TaxID=1798382 RepID=A0A1F5ZTG7_9BACT|nr:MAG: hypothetical protein A3D77_00755 [Candidatus Gottesmanbacteria bacterium RIFCSPHIGHO2_02_FULL_39_11]